MMVAANASVCLLNSGAIRLDDQLMGTITEYDILRCLPFAANITVVRVNGSLLVKVLTRGLASIHTGMFISYAGLEYNAIKGKWFLPSTGQLLDDENLQLTVASIPYFFANSDLKQSSEFVQTPITITRAFIDHLERTFPKPPNGHQKPS